jgi:hypothetical protein
MPGQSWLLAPSFWLHIPKGYQGRSPWLVSITLQRAFAQFVSRYLTISSVSSDQQTGLQTSPSQSQERFTSARVPRLHQKTQRRSLRKIQWSSWTSPVLRATHLCKRWRPPTYVIDSDALGSRVRFITGQFKPARLELPETSQPAD